MWHNAPEKNINHIFLERKLWPMRRASQEALNNIKLFKEPMKNKSEVPSDFFLKA